MASALVLLDKALELGRRELAHLAAGEMDEADELAAGRGRMLSEALADASLEQPAVENTDALLEKLMALKDLQAQIIDEAARQRQDVAARLRNTGMEEKRHAGYGRMTRPVPRVQSRYISRNS